MFVGISWIYGAVWCYRTLQVTDQVTVVVEGTLLHFRGPARAFSAGAMLLELWCMRAIYTRT